MLLCINASTGWMLRNCLLFECLIYVSCCCNARLIVVLNDIEAQGRGSRHSFNSEPPNRVPAKIHSASRYVLGTPL
ncbi:hypothetical protein J3E68DRAFT_234743 [Trichoderma sp. SZMC 28012]